MRIGTTINADLACQRAMDRLAAVGFGALTEEERVLATVWTLQSDVENGGFARYYSSAAGDLAFFGPAALKHIGAHHRAGVVTEANGVFGPEGPPRDRARREQLVNALTEESRRTLEVLYEPFMESPDDTNALMETYLDRG